MAVALSVSSLSYYARVHLCFRNMFQQRPLMAGDTVRALFCLNSRWRWKSILHCPQHALVGESTRRGSVSSKKINYVFTKSLQHPRFGTNSTHSFGRIEVRLPSISLTTTRRQVSTTFATPYLVARTASGT